MRFDRLGHITPKGITPRRLAAARKAVQRDKEKWALFPEFVQHQSPEDRITDIDRGLVEGDIERRLTQAGQWLQLRTRLNALPPALRAGVLRYWNTTDWLPGSPTFLAGLIYDAEVGRFNPAAKFAEIERCRLLGEITRQVSTSIPLPQSPIDGPKDITFLKLHVGNEIARAIAPNLFAPRDEGSEYDVFEGCRASRMNCE